MRVTSALWVSAFIRRCAGHGVAAIVARKGAAEAGAIHIRIDRLDGTVHLYAPAPQSALADGISERVWAPVRDAQALAEAEAASILERERRFDPDLWIIDVEDRHGRHFLLPPEVVGCRPVNLKSTLWQTPPATR